MLSTDDVSIVRLPLACSNVRRRDIPPRNSRTRPSEGASQSVLHPKTIFRLDELNKCVQAFLRFRVGSHSLLCITGCVANARRAQRVFTLCPISQDNIVNLGNEEHLVFEYLSASLAGSRRLM